MAVADFLADGFAAGQPTLVIATSDHRKRIRAELVARHFSVSSLIKTGSVMMLDTHEMLEQFMVNGRPHSARFRAALGWRLSACPCLAVSRSCVATAKWWTSCVAPGDTTRPFSWKASGTSWPRLTRFRSSCGYAIGNVASNQVYADVCAPHPRARRGRRRLRSPPSHRRSGRFTARGAERPGPPNVPVSSIETASSNPLAVKGLSRNASPSHASSRTSSRRFMLPVT